MITFIIGLFVGGIVGFFTAAIFAAASRGSRMDEFIYRGRQKEK